MLKGEGSIGKLKGNRKEISRDVPNPNYLLGHIIWRSLTGTRQEYNGSVPGPRWERTEGDAALVRSEYEVVAWPPGSSPGAPWISPSHRGLASWCLSWSTLDLAKPSVTGFLEPPMELSGSRQGIGDWPSGASHRALWISPRHRGLSSWSIP